MNRELTDYLDENWRDLRCQPIIMPIAGLSRKAEGKTFFDRTASNFQYCSTSQMGSMMDVFMRPFMGLLQGVGKGASNIRNVIDGFRGMAKVIREMFAILVGNTFKRMSNSYAAVIYLQEKIKTIIKRQTAMFEVIQHFLTTVPFLLAAFANGPIPRFAFFLQRYLGLLITMIVICLLCLTGGFFVSIVACPICALCFDGSMIVDGKPIRDYEIGDILGDSKITGKMTLPTDLYHLYQYHTVRVSGSHLVFDKGQWKRIDECDSSRPISCHTDLVCFWTNPRQFTILGQLFRDYQEVDDVYMLAFCNQVSLDALNGKAQNDVLRHSEDTLHTYPSGFLTAVLEDDVGLIQIKADTVKWFDYKGRTLSGTTIVWEHGNWVRVYQSEYSTPMTGLTVEYVYHHISSNHLLWHSGLLFQDFAEMTDESTQDFILEQLALVCNQSLSC